MDGGFTRKAQEVINAAQQAALELGHDYIGTEHILIGLIDVKDSVSAKALESQGVSKKDIVEKIASTIGINTGNGVPQGYTPGCPQYGNRICWNRAHTYSPFGRKRLHSRKDTCCFGS